MVWEELRQKTCCFTGHRDLPADKSEEIAERTAGMVRTLITEYGVCFFGVGGAVGYDTLAAEVLFRLREEEFPNIKVILVYPFDGFIDRWPQAQRAKYQRLLPKYDKVVCASSQPEREAYLKRNRCLVDGSAYCIAYCAQDYGGTAYTVRYAGRKGIPVWNVADHRI